MAEETESPLSVLENIWKNLQRLPLKRRMWLLALLALGISAIPVLVMVGQEPNMTVLFSNLEEGDVQAILTRLEGQSIPYSLEAGGNTVMVPEGRVHELRLQMASEGLPDSSDVGFEIFDRSGLGIGDFVQKVNYRRALQGELARTISQMPGVRRTRVHLVIPERRLFSSDREPAQAAVVVTSKRGVTLNSSQVQGIVHLVASSVQGLDPSQVTVVDGRGQMLTHPETEGQAEMTGSQQKVQRALEAGLEQRVQTMLDRVLGPNTSVVRVSAALDFRQVEVTEEQYDPDGQVIRSEQRSQEKVVGEDSPTGVPGARSNVPGEESLTRGGGSKEAKRKSETINYEVNRKVSKIIEPSGTLQRLSVAVMIDGTYEPVVNEETGETTSRYVPRSEEEMNQLTESIKKAVGFSAERGDQIEVVNRRFVAPVVEIGDEETTMGMVQGVLISWGGYVKPIAFFILAFLVLQLMIKPLVKHLATPPPPEASTLKGLPATVAELEVEKKVVVTPEQQAVQLAVQNPQAAAFVIREWIKEENERVKA